MIRLHLQGRRARAVEAASATRGLQGCAQWQYCRSDLAEVPGLIRGAAGVRRISEALRCSVLRPARTHQPRRGERVTASEGAPYYRPRVCGWGCAVQQSRARRPRQWPSSTRARTTRCLHDGEGYSGPCPSYLQTAGAHALVPPWDFKGRTRAGRSSSASPSTERVHWEGAWCASTAVSPS